MSPIAKPLEQHLLQRLNVHLYQINPTLDGDIVPIDLHEIFDFADYVLRQAALPSVHRSVRDPLHSNEASVSGP